MIIKIYDTSKIWDSKNENTIWSDIHQGLLNVIRVKSSQAHFSNGMQKPKTRSLTLKKK